MEYRDPRRVRLGAYITELRKERRLSRSKLLNRVAQILDDDDELWAVLSEVCIKHIEQGTRAAITRHMLDVLCRALDCTNDEKARLLWYADRNVTLSEEPDPSDSIVMLNVVMARLHQEAAAILDSLRGQVPSQNLTEREMLVIVLKTLQIVLDHNEAFPKT